MALVPYVGASALQRLVDWGVAHPAELLDADAALAALDTSVEGLWFTSESDYPLVPFAIDAAGPLALADVKDVLAEVYVPRAGEPGLAERTVEESSVAWAFDRTTVPEDWWEPSQLEAQPQWQAVRDVFELGLQDTQVFRIGEQNPFGILSRAIDVFVFGTTSDDVIIGVRTVSVETWPD